MKRMRFLDSISTILVLFGFGLYGSTAMASGRWYMQRSVRHSRCDYRPVYAALSVLPPLPWYDVFSSKKTYCPHCSSNVCADRNV